MLPRPAGRSGVVYGAAHVRLGLRPELEGRVLVPVPLLEAGGAAVLTAACAGMVVRWCRAGHGARVYLAAYGIGRWILECLRGDRRATWFGSSHTQWTALVVSVAVTVLQAGAALPQRPPHLAVVVVLACATAYRMRGPRRGETRLFATCRSRCSCR